MLRFLLLLLVLLNGVYFAWSQGFMATLGLAPQQQTEPQRLRQQLRPEAVRLLSADELRLAQAQPPLTTIKPAECLQAGLFNESQGGPLRSALTSALPAGSWTLESNVEPARWIVYMGKYASAEDLLKKRTQLAALNLKFEPLSNPELEFGLSLGRFASQAQARAALADLSLRGVRTARVVLEHAELRGLLLRVPSADDAMKTSLLGLSSVLTGKLLSPCQ